MFSSSTPSFCCFGRASAAKKRVSPASQALCVCYCSITSAHRVCRFLSLQFFIQPLAGMVLAGAQLVGRCWQDLCYLSALSTRPAGGSADSTVSRFTGPAAITVLTNCQSWAYLRQLCFLSCSCGAYAACRTVLHVIGCIVSSCCAFDGCGLGYFCDSKRHSSLVSKGLAGSVQGPAHASVVSFAYLLMHVSAWLAVCWWWLWWGVA